MCILYTIGKRLYILAEEIYEVLMFLALRQGPFNVVTMYDDAHIVTVYFDGFAVSGEHLFGKGVQEVASTPPMSSPR